MWSSIWVTARHHQKVTGIVFHQNRTGVVIYGKRESALQFAISVLTLPVSLGPPWYVNKPRKTQPIPGNLLYTWSLIYAVGGCCVYNNKDRWLRLPHFYARVKKKGIVQKIRGYTYIRWHGLAERKTGTLGLNVSFSQISNRSLFKGDGFTMCMWKELACNFSHDVFKNIKFAWTF